MRSVNLNESSYFFITIESSKKIRYKNNNDVEGTCIKFIEMYNIPQKRGPQLFGEGP